MFKRLLKADRFVREYVKKLSRGAGLLVITFIASVLLFGYITHEVILEQEEVFDQRVFRYLSAYVISPQLTGFMKIVTWCASATFLRIAYGLVVVIYLFRKDLKRAAEIGVIGFGGFIINYVMKLSFQRDRPVDPMIDPLRNFSFPTGHATSGFIFYGLLAYLVWKTSLPKSIRMIIVSLLILFSLTIGFSRIYLRMHYTTDVLAGFAIGILWLVFSIWMMEKFKKRTDAEISQMN
jgi:membrane-associated phospholipid phosphatase